MFKLFFDQLKILTQRGIQLNHGCLVQKPPGFHTVIFTAPVLCKKTFVVAGMFPHMIQIILKDNFF